MPCLADTNILLRLMHRGDPEHQLVRTALRLLRRRGERIFYAPQNLVEILACLHAAGIGERVRIVDRGNRWPRRK